MSSYLNNLELGLVEGHEPEVEAREQSGQAEQDQDEDGHQPDGQQQLVDLQLKQTIGYYRPSLVSCPRPTLILL